MDRGRRERLIQRREYHLFQSFVLAKDLEWTETDNVCSYICTGKGKGKTTGEKYDTIIEKWICEHFRPMRF